MYKPVDIIFQNDDIVAVFKPSGISTHAPDPDHPGLVEMLAKQLGQKIGVHQRLDAETSGIIVFSKSPAGAKKLASAFENRRLSKIYYAVVCGRPAQDSGQWKHFLKHAGGETVESPDGKQAICNFKCERTIGPFSLLKLELLTGITHQLRVQCALAGCPILGDSRYGGGDHAPRLYLHAHSLQCYDIRELPRLTANLPAEFSANLDTLLASILSHADVHQIPPNEAIRLIVPQHSGIPEIILEKVASVLLVRHLEPAGKSLWDETSLRILFDQAKAFYGCTDVSYHVHKSPASSHACDRFEQAFSHIPEPVNATEHGNLYAFDFSGNATGLYLDQRENRKWVMQHAHGRVLNLFAYTCAFSICAAKSPEVTETTSIDAAPAALNKGRHNFDLNGINPGCHQFIHQDVLKYLDRCAKNHIRFDTIICDPPSFGRFNKIVFSLEKDLGKLLESCIQAAAPNAVILFSINHRRISLSSLNAMLRQLCRQYRLNPVLCEAFVNDSATGPLGVGTDLKTIRMIL